MVGREAIISLIRLMRIPDWWDKLQIFISAALILMLLGERSSASLIPILFMGIYLPLYLTYGFVVNSYFDREADKSVNKQPVVRRFTKKQHLIVAVAFGIPAIILPLIYQDLRVSIVGLTLFLLGTSYSAPPLRLKEKGIFGPLTAALIQRTLPFYLYTLMAPAEERLVYFLIGWLTLTGLADMFGHQVFDYENDRRAGVKTLAQKLGFEPTIKITILSMCVSGLYICTAPLIFGMVNGLALALMLIVFSGSSVPHIVCVIKEAREKQKTSV